MPRRRASGRLLGVPLLLVAGAVGLAATAARDRPQATGRADQGPLAATLRTGAQQLVAAGAPGVVVLARRRDEIVRIAEGRVALGSPEAIRPTDRFRLGSVAKTYVATVVLQLVVEHRLGLQDTVERWLPGLVPGGGKITVQELLLHRSGLYDYWGDKRFFAPYRLGNFAYRYTPRQLIAFAPGTGFSYTNTGYIVLGLIVEAVTGRPLGVELQDRIFRPLHLNGTSFGRGTPRNGRNAHGYTRIGGRVRDVSGLNLSFDWAAGAVVSTADDIARFYRGLLGGRLLPPAFVRLMPRRPPAARGGTGSGS
jgi:D-alanyl-D-alanine carboxypeptidase